MAPIRYTFAMRLHRFYLSEEVKDKKEILTSDQRLLHQWRDVLRMKTGDRLTVFDGRGKDFLCEVKAFGRDGTILTVLEAKKGIAPEKNVWLFVSLTKKDKLEWVAEKATELGVSHIVPILSERSEKKGFNEERLRKIIIEASEQSGRAVPTALHGVFSLDEAIEKHKNVPLFALDPSGSQNIADLKKETLVGFFIGPEGGWNDGELNLFKKEKIPLISLGEPTLRAETAAIAASALALS